MKSYQTILMFLMPFANEIANALTISDTLDDTKFRRLYKPCDEDMTSKLESGLIDFIALFGICWNVSYMGSKFGTRAGVFYGCIVVLLSFIIPNQFMEKFVNLYGGKYNSTKLISCVLFILFLLLIELIACKYIKLMGWKYNRFSSLL